MIYDLIQYNVITSWHGKSQYLSVIIIFDVRRKYIIPIIRKYNQICFITTC